MFKRLLLGWQTQHPKEPSGKTPADLCLPRLSHDDLIEGLKSNVRRRVSLQENGLEINPELLWRFAFGDARAHDPNIVRRRSGRDSADPLYQIEDRLRTLIRHGAILPQNLSAKVDMLATILSDADLPLFKRGKGSRSLPWSEPFDSHTTLRTQFDAAIGGDREALRQLGTTREDHLDHIRATDDIALRHPGIANAAARFPPQSLFDRRTRSRTGYREEQGQCHQSA